MNLLPLSLLSPHRLVSLARKEYARGDNRRALMAVDKALEKLARKFPSVFNTSSDSASQASEAWLLKGQVHKAAGEKTFATASFFSAYQLNTSDGDTLNFLTSELLEAGDLSERAKSVYLNFLTPGRHLGKSERSKRNLLLLEILSGPDWNRPQTISVTERWNKIISSLRKDLAWPHRHLGEIALSYGDWSKAVRSFQAALGLSPSNYKTQQNLAFALLKAERFQEAKGRLDDLISQQRNLGALLLRAHAHRALGDYARAALDFRMAADGNDLLDEGRLVYAEACINSGYLDEAMGQLNLVDDYYDPRCLLLRGIIDETQHRVSEALFNFSLVMFSTDFCGQAVSRTLALLARRPDAPEGLTTLNGVPESYWDDLYWSVRGNVLLDLGQVAEAVDAWALVMYPDHDLRETINSAVRNHLAALYARGKDLAIIREVRNGLAATTDSDEVAEIVVAALSRYALKGLRRHSDLIKLLKDIDLVAGSFPDYGEPSRFDLLRALVHVSHFDYAKATEIFAKFGPEFAGNEELILLIANCSALSGAAEQCLGALKSVKKEDHRAIKIRCALSAINGEWNAAAKSLAELPSSHDYDEFRAAILFGAGRWTELETLNGHAAHAGSYYRIAHRLQSGDGDSATRILSSIPVEEPCRARSDRLFGWLHLQEAHNFRNSGERTRANECLIDALILWPEENGPASCLNSLAANLMSSLLGKKNGVNAIGVMFEAWAAGRDPADPASCHNLGIFHFCNGVRSAESGDFEGAIESWEKSIAYICIPLSNQTYLMEWVRRRLQSYRISQAVDSIQIQQDLLRYYDACWKKWSEELTNRSMEAEAARVSDLAIALRAELRGADLLSMLGGFSITANSFEKISAGPTFISMTGHARSFAAFLSDLKVKDLESPKSSGDDPLAALLDFIAKREVEESEGAIDPALKERLELLFSGLRCATIRQEDGSLESALRRLREVKTTFDARIANGARRKTERYRVHLTERNPAFERQRGRTDFRELARRQEVKLLMALGEQDFAATDDRISSGIEYWREVISLAWDVEYERVVQKLRETAMGRAYVLRHKGQLQQAVRLLEAAYELCNDEEVRNLLSTYYAEEGVEAAHREEWVQAVSRLRKATDLNPQSMYAQPNLARVLIFVADEVQLTDPTLASALLQEVMQSMRVCRDLDPDNDEYRTTEILSRAKLNMLSIRAGEITMDDLSPEDRIGIALLLMR